MSVAKIQKYDHYKPSGIDWLGEIPSHWKVKRLKEIARIDTGSKNTEDNIEDGFYPFFVRSQIVERINTYAFDGEAVLTAGDGAGVGKVFHYINGKFDYHQRVYKVSHFRGVTGKFFFYYMMENFYKDALRFNAKSTVDSLRLPMFQHFTVTFGSQEEQQAIADYLDAKTAQIDSKIEILEHKAEKYIDLKKSLINETITHGLDKTVLMKVCGLKWVSQIPAHWEIRRAKDLFKKMSRSASETEGIVTAFRDGQVTLRENRRTSGFTNAVFEHGYQGIRTGDLVIHAMDGFAGAIGVSDSDGKSSPVYQAYTPVDPKRVHNPYYGLLVREMALSGFVSSLGKGIRERSSEFRHKEFAPLELPVPPFEEQKAIADYLKAKTAHIDKIIETIHLEIEKLKELRKTLINDVVTGKIKVYEGDVSAGR